jgi:acyl dehydratase
MAAPQLYFEDVEVGMEIPPLEKHPTPRQLVRYAGASGDYAEIHYNMEIAQSRGLPSPILHGLLKCAFIAQMMTDWLGEWGDLRTFETQYRRVDVYNVPYTCRGRVVNKYVKDSENWVECEVWGENPQDGITTIGKATATLPSKPRG